VRRRRCRTVQRWQRLAKEQRDHVGITVPKRELLHQQSALLAHLGQAAGGQGFVQFDDGLAGAGLYVAQLVLSCHVRVSHVYLQLDRRICKRRHSTGLVTALGVYCCASSGTFANSP
jgi:hypothetical protein